MTGPNPTYEATIIHHSPLTGKIPGKFYLTNIEGRTGPQKREWPHNTHEPLLAKRNIERVLESTSPLVHVPRIVIAFPHVTRVYRFGNPFNPSERETNLYTEIYETPTMEPLRAHEIGCDGEIAILAQEREFWRDAKTVEEYLRKFIPQGSLGKVQNPNKLYEFLRQQESR